MDKLVATNLGKVIGGKTIVRRVSLEICAGEIVGLLGPNGAGKTTTFYMISGLIPVTRGTVVLNGNNLKGKPLHERALLGIGYLPQESSIFKDLTVYNNLLVAGEVAFRRNKSGMKKRIEEIIEMFRIDRIRDSRGVSLSGGERRRVEVARALVNSPKFILFDEPFAGVDPIAVDDIKDIIKNLKSIGVGILITDHNVRETLEISDHAYIIKDGQILASGTIDEVTKNQEVIKNYLGKSFE